MTFVVGLTGGIGSGKSTVSHLFSHYDVPIIDADHITHVLLEKDKDVIRTITNHFGPSVLQAQSLNRPVLRDIVFQDPNERQWLEHFLHPIISKIIREECRRIKAPYCLIAIPLLKSSSEVKNILDRVLVVDAPEEVCIARIKKRNEFSETRIRQIMDAQISGAERLAMADDIIWNNQTTAVLEKTVSLLHQQYLLMSSKFVI